jgi:predicted phosphodiesterase
MGKKFKVIIASDIHYNCANYFGRPFDEAMELLIKDLACEYSVSPYEALLLLGDYSLDFWCYKNYGSYLNLGISSTKLFVERYLDRPVPKNVEIKMIAGNHEQYGEKLFNEITGHNRRDHIVIGNILFILTDTFGLDLDPDFNSDGTYSGANVSEIKQLLLEFSDKKVVICAHHFDMQKESQEFLDLLNSEERIICLFSGHEHKSHVKTTGENAGNKPIIFTGHYSYSGEPDNTRCLPGYRVVEFDETKFSTKYVEHSHKYKIGDTYVTNEYTEKDIVEINY